MENTEVEERARELIAGAAHEGEAMLLERLRSGTGQAIFARIKRGLKTHALLNTAVGRAFAEKCQSTIVESCDVWLSTDRSQEKADAALIEARAAVAALNIFGEMLQDGKQAEEELRMLDEDDNG